MKVVKKIFNVIIDIIVVAILIVSSIVVVISLTSNETGIPNLFGTAPLSVRSNSMEPTLMIDDLILSEFVDDPYAEYEVGDIVTFPISIEGYETYNTHRIVEVIKEGGFTYYRTQGDNKTTNPEPDEDLQTSMTIKAKYTGKRIAGVGGFFSFIRTQLGFFLVILLPMIIFFIYEAIRVIMNIIAYNKEKAIEAAHEVVENSELTEEQKQKAIAEYLASIGQNQDSGNERSVQTPADGKSSDADT